MHSKSRDEWTTNTENGVQAHSCDDIAAGGARVQHGAVKWRQWGAGVPLTVRDRKLSSLLYTAVVVSSATVMPAVGARFAARATSVLVVRGPGCGWPRLRPVSHVDSTPSVPWCATSRARPGAPAAEPRLRGAGEGEEALHRPQHRCPLPPRPPLPARSSHRRPGGRTASAHRGGDLRKPAWRV